MLEVCADQMRYISRLFESGMALSCIQGHGGRAWANCLSTPDCACIVTLDFCTFAGDHRSTDAPDLIRRAIAESVDAELIMYGGTDGWDALIERVCPQAKRIIRYAVNKSGAFARELLEEYVRCLPGGYVLRVIDADIYPMIDQNPQMRDLLTRYTCAEEYLKNELGFCVMYDGEVVCGAAPYLLYDSGIEIQIDTHPSHQRRGLALACASKLILTCMERGIEPCWDAASIASLELAKKLGYAFVREYFVYEITNN